MNGRAELCAIGAGYDGVNPTNPLTGGKTRMTHDATANLKRRQAEWYLEHGEEWERANPWGLCPDCHAEPVFEHYVKSNIATCQKCKTYWVVGSVMTNPWRWDDKHNAAVLEHLKTFREVEPYGPPPPPAAARGGASPSLQLERSKPAGSDTRAQPNIEFRTW